MWQDYVLMAGGVGFAIGLLPSVFGKNKPERSSSIITGSILAIYCVCYATLNLWFAFSSTILVAGLWFTLAIQASQGKEVQKGETI